MVPIRVLCIDDSPDVLAVLTMLLNRAPDLTCVGALGTADGLTAEVESRGAEVVVLDVGIPYRDSLGRLDELKRSGSLAKVIVFSGDNDDESVNRCLAAGASACVTKATDPRILLDTIRGVVRNSPDLADHPGQVRFFRNLGAAPATPDHHHVR